MMEFIVPGKNRAKFCRVNAHIVQRTQTGLELMIDNFNEGVI